MKKNILKMATLSLSLGVLFASCSKSFLELQPKGQSLESNYYSTPAEAFAGLVAAYSPLSTTIGGIDNTYSSFVGLLDLASDDCWAGGGGSSDTPIWQVWNTYTLTPAQGPQGEFWQINYTGVSNCNTILSKLPGVPGLGQDTLKRYTAEAKFLRAHYYFDLERLFKNIPLITQPLDVSEARNVLQTSPDSVYAQIEADLKDAIPDLPPTVSASENGRATQGAAIALLGKVYLYEQKWSDAVSELAQVNGTAPGSVTPVYGYSLMPNFGDIFSPDHKFNSESIFEVTFTGSQAYTWSQYGTAIKGNVLCVMVGPRTSVGPDYYIGYGFDPIVKSTLVQAMHPAGTNYYDPRYKYTIANMDSLAKANGLTYAPPAGNNDSGYLIQKYAPQTKYVSATGDAPLNFPNDYIEIRLADTYLMEAEALVHTGSNTSRAAALLNAVRARVGLAAESATLDNIYKERQLELATEGHRWYDLVRTGQAATALAFKGFKGGTNEILPIPLPDMQNTKMVQNPGY